MNVAQINMNDIKNIDSPNTKLAYTIIQTLLAHQESLSDLLTLMAHALDEDVTKALTNNKQWETYIESKRELENTKLQIEKFTEELRRLENSRSWFWSLVMLFIRLIIFILILMSLNVLAQTRSHSTEQKNKSLAYKFDE